MQNCKRKRIGVTLGLAVVALASSLAPSKAQAQENFAWITNTNGVTWKAEIDGLGQLDFFRDWRERTLGRIAEIVVPEHARIGYINVRDCVNLTNIILHIDKPQTLKLNGDERALIIFAGESGLRNITCQKTMRDLIWLRRFPSFPHFVRFHEGEWAKTVQWTELPQIEIRTHSTPNGKELEVIWREGNLQIADAVNGEWRDHIGASPLRFPLAIAKPQQFFRIRKGDD